MIEKFELYLGRISRQLPSYAASSGELRNLFPMENRLYETP